MSTRDPISTRSSHAEPQGPVEGPRVPAPLRHRVLLFTSGGVGCWEQWSETWFPQMKWQKAVQAFERVQYQDQVDPFMPPEGTVPVDAVRRRGGPVRPGRRRAREPLRRRELQAPSAAGQELYQTVYCETCHGATAWATARSRWPATKRGPFAGVFPLVTASGRSDGYIYNLIRAGGARMPAYDRIPATIAGTS